MDVHFFDLTLCHSSDIIHGKARYNFWGRVSENHVTLIGLKTLLESTPSSAMKFTHNTTIRIPSKVNGHSKRFSISINMLLTFSF